MATPYPTSLLRFLGAKNESLKSHGIHSYLSQARQAGLLHLA
jgi:hypothetical protein